MTQRIAVIGAGPAGLAAAREAARRGMKVTLFEKDRVGEGIRCAEAFFDSLRALEPPEAGVRFRVKALRFRARQEYEFSTKDLRLWMVDRRVWQRHLAETSGQEGVEILENQPVSRRNFASLKREYDWIIDASGTPPVTSLIYGFRDFYLPNSLVTAQYVLGGDFSHLREKLKVGLGPDYLGYYWIFPRGEDTANVGLALLPEDYAPRDINSLWLRLRRALEVEGLAGARVLGRCGGLCPARVPPRLVWDNVILVGDAAGLTSPLHGGGIDLALLSGREAVAAIADGEVRNYRQRLLARVGPRLRAEAELARLWAASSFEEIERLLAGVSDFWQGRGIGPLLPLSRDLLQKGYYLLRYWRALHRGFS